MALYLHISAVSFLTLPSEKELAVATVHMSGPAEITTLHETYVSSNSVESTVEFWKIGEQSL